MPSRLIFLHERLDPAPGALISFTAVLGLAYGSLMLLKRAGIGGASAGRSGGTNQGMRVVSSLALAPNRTVHVIKVAGGRTLPGFHLA